MPSIIAYLSLDEYSPGDVVTVHVNKDEIEADFGYEYDKTELHGIDGSVIQSSSSPTFIALDDAKYEFVGDYWVIEFHLFAFIEGESTYIYYTLLNWNPNAIWVVITKPRIIIPLKGGGKVAIPIYTPEPGDKTLTIPLANGGKAITKIVEPAPGDTVVILPLKWGGKVAIVIKIAKITGNLTLQMRYVGLTPGATSQIRFDVKVMGDVPLYMPAFFGFGPLWDAEQRYDGHFSTEYYSETNCSTYTNEYTTVSTPAFICPTNGGLNIAFYFGLSAVRAHPFPIFINNVQILVNGVWEDVPEHDFYSAQWHDGEYAYTDTEMGDYWSLQHTDLISAIYQAEDGVGCKIYIV